MKKSKKIVLTVTSIFLIVIIGIVSFLSYKFNAGKNYTSDTLEVAANMILPKSETYKVTSTAKGDNQTKVARMNGCVYTFYLDNSGLSDSSARGNDKTMRLIKIDENGNSELFDSIPVWMHGNILADPLRNKIYVTTYEEDFFDNYYYCSVKVYTYTEGEELIRESVTTLADDKLILYEANPRVGADIDEFGNVAVAFSNYAGIMYVHILNAESGLWNKYSIEYYHETYMNDCVLYPYIRIKGLNCIRIAANRDTSVMKNGQTNADLMRNYTRYFSFDGNEWTHFIVADLRDKDPDGSKGIKSAPIDLYIDSDYNTHLITKENLDIKYYIIDSEEIKEEKALIKIKNEAAVYFIRTAEISGKKYYVVSGVGYKGLYKETGYVEVYEGGTNKLLYRNNSVCNEPYLYINRLSSENYLDLELISRDKDYKENSDTHYISLKL